MSYFLFDEAPGRVATVKGVPYLFFSGYAYLGLQHVPGFKALVKEGIDKYGWLFPSSRISNTRIALYEECEQLLSTIMQCEATVLVSSGYTAGRLATGKWKDDICNLYPSHPAIRRNTNQSLHGVFAVDSVNVLTASVTDIGTIAADARVKTLIIDDSHSTGITGVDGGGAGSYFERRAGVDHIFTCSLSKAWSINAGAVSCSRALAEEYRNEPAYTAATAPSPALLYAFMKGQDIYAEQRALLKENIVYFQSLVSTIKGIGSHPSLPVFVLPPNVDEDALLAKNIIISSFAYPDPNGQKIKRIVLNALHTKNDLEYLAECLTQLL